MKKIMLGLIALIPIVLIFTIQLTSVVIESTNYIAVEKVMFSIDQMTIKKPDKNNVEFDFPATVLPVAATDKSLIYESSDEDIAVVDAYGNITFKEFGHVTITAKSKVANLIKDDCDFFVTDDKVHEVNILNKMVAITKGESYKLQTQIIPAEALDKNLKFESSNTDVASISPDGTISTIEGGFTTITATSANGIQDCFVLQVVVPVEKIEIVGASKLTTGRANAQFPEIVFTPSNSTNQNVRYTSSDTSVATISASGEILFYKAGEVTFTAKSADGGYTTQYRVEYTGGYVKGAEIVNATQSLNYTYSSMMGQIIPIEIKITPADADVSNVWLESSNETAVKIVDGQAVVNGGGKAVITMYARSSDDTTITSTKEVYITRPATEIVVNNAPANAINTKEFKLDYTVLTADHTDTITFSVDSGIASVDSSGMVTFNTPGEVVVTITANANAKKDVTIKYIPSGATEIQISANNQNIEINLNDNVVFTFAKSLDMGSTTFAVSGTSANGGDVLNYNSLNKVITGINGGDGVVTATGNNTITINVKVIKDVSSISYSVSGVDFSTGAVYTALKEFSVTASTLPVDATLKIVDIQVDDTSVAVVNGTTIKFLKAGKVVVTLSANKNPNTEEVVSTSFTATSTYGELDEVEIIDSVTTYECEYVNNEEITLSVNVLPIDGDTSKVIFESSNSSVVKVADNKIYIVGGGECTIIAKNSAGTSSSTRNVFVSRQATGITLNGITTDSVEISDIEYIISYITEPIDNTDSVTYEIHSEVASIATYSRASGTLTVVFDAPGEAVVTIIANDNVKKQITITYIPSGAESYTISENNQSLEIDYGKNFVLIFDETLSMGEVEYSIEGTSLANASVLTFDSTTQVFTANNGGNAVITAEGDVTITINVTVIRNVTSIEYNLTGATLSNGSVTSALTEFGVTANTYPADATIRTVEITSGDSSIAIVMDGNIEFLKAGTVEFVVKALKRPNSVEYVTAVFSITSTFGCIETITLESTEKYTEEYQENKEIVFNFSVYPSDADITLVQFASTNENVVKVEDNKLYIVGGGTTTIQLTAVKANGQLASAVREVFITRPATEIIINNAPTNTITTTEYTVSYSVLTADHTDTITFSVDLGIASVDSSGLVTFNTPGEVVLTITANENVKSEVSIKYIPNGASEIQIIENNQNVEVDVNDEIVFTFAKFLNMGNTTFAVSGTSANGSEVLNYNALNKVITAVSGGDGVVTATGNSIITINVKSIRNTTSIDYSVSGVTLSDGQINTSKKEFTIVSNTLPVDATIKEVRISTSDESVAIVNNGKIEFLKAGTVTITLTSLVNPNSSDVVSAVFIATSSYGLPTSFEVVGSVIIADVGLSTQIIFGSVFAPSDYELNRSDFTFTSDDSSIASVDSTGLISGKSWGTTTIYVSVVSGGTTITKTIEVEVQEKSDSVDFIYNGSVLNGGYIMGDSIQLSSKILPTTTNYQAVKYYITEIIDGDESDVAIDENTGVLTFNNAVAVRVTVETLDNGTTRTIYIMKITGPDELQVYYNDSLVTDLIKIEANGADPVVNIRPIMSANSEYPDGLIDINLSDIEYDIVNEDGLTTTLTPTTSGGYRYFTISHSTTIVKSLTTTITFRYGTTTYNISVKFFALQGISLTLDNEDDIDYGLEQRRVFGSYNHKDNAWYDVLDIEHANTPTDVEDQLYWFVKATDTNYAFFESSTSGVFKLKISALNDALLNMTTWEDGYDYATIKVTIFVGNESDYTLYDNLLTTPSTDPTFKWDYYTYTFVYGCNVFDGDDFDYCWQKYQSLVLHANIGTDEDKVDGQNFGVMSDTTKNTANHLSNVYGNGYTLNFEGHQGNTNSVNEICLWSTTSRIIVTNTNFKGQNVDTSKETYTRSLLMAGGRMQYCTAQGFDLVYVNSIEDEYVSTYYSNTEFYRCIFRHMSICGMQMYGINRKMYIEDCIFYDVAQCSVEFQEGELYIKGFLDIYNFVTPSEYDTTYQSTIKSIFSSDEFSDYVDKSGSEITANVGVLIISAYKPRNVDTVYFWDNSTNTYIANVDNCTGYNYTKVSKNKKIVFIYVYTHMWLMPLDGANAISQTDVPDITKLRRVYL